MMRAMVVVILSAFLIFLLVEVVSYTSRKGDAQAKFDELKLKLERVRADRSVLEEDYEYLKNPANLEKELRARFNYKGADEKTIIIVPQASSTQ